MLRLLTFVCVIALLFGTAREAAAQGTWADRGYINVGFGIESGSTTMSDTKTATIYEETAQIASTASFSSGSLFDIGVGLRVWRNLTVGVSYHQEDNVADGTVSGSVPSPVVFNRPRNFSTTAPGLHRKEMATHLQFGWVVPIRNNFDVLVFVGPTWFRLNQDVVSDVTLGERGAPFTEVVASPIVSERNKSVVGFNAGVDATYIFWSNDNVRLGGGGFIRFTSASTDVFMLTTDQPTDVGGVQFGFGGRIRF